MKRFSELPRQERIDKVMELRRDDFALILENLAEPTNISAILRTAEAFGVGRVYIVHTDQKKPRLSMNTSSGATKWLNVEYFSSITECVQTLKSEGFIIIGALVDPNAKVLWEEKYSGKVAIVMGTEVSGMSEEAQKVVDHNIYLPMFGLTESLNVSVAAGIFLYEVIRQKEAIDRPSK